MYRALLAGLYVGLLTGCTVTAGGTAVRAPMGPDEAVVALMNTGSYPVTAGPPVGPAGTDRLEAGDLEAHRMGEYVTGPWQANTTLVKPDYISEAPLGAPPNVSVAIGYPLVSYQWADELVDISKAHNFVAGFNTGRTGSGSLRRLQNVVLRFPDAQSAAAAASEMAAVEAPTQLQLVLWFPQPESQSVALNPPWRPGACSEYSTNPVHPDFSAVIGDGVLVVVRSLTAHGPYVLYQFVIADKEINACSAVAETVNKQEGMLDRFVPTEPANMADLPADPTGQLYSRTLWAMDDNSPVSDGVWQPSAWLHFEDDPIKAATLFTAAGVDWVTQRLTRVYRARDAAGAKQVVSQLVADTVATAGAEPTAAGVSGFRGAKCFARPNLAPRPQTEFARTLQAFWHFKCVAQTDRYAFVSFADQETDAKQQISAQYRILAGK